MNLAPGDTAPAEASEWDDAADEAPVIVTEYQQGESRVTLRPEDTHRNLL